MDNYQNKNIDLNKIDFSKITSNSLLGVLVAILFFFTQNVTNSISAMQKLMSSIRILITEIKNSILSREDIVKLIDLRIQIFRYNNGKFKE